MKAFKTMWILAIVPLFLIAPNLNSYAKEKAIIKINISSDGELINRRIFGSSILGWESDHGRKTRKNYKLSADYCHGLWDGKWDEYAEEPISLVKNIKIGSIRLIGQFIDWEKGVEEFGKKEYAFGLNEQLKFCQDIGAEPIICLQNLESKENYTNLFKYLKEHYPYIKYVEIGCESFDVMSPEEYTEKYLYYYEGIKKINPNIMIGFVGRDVMWESKVLDIIGNRFDFIIEHYYPRGGTNNDPRQDSNKVFTDLMPKATVIEKKIQNTLSLMDATLGKRKPIAVTEYNAWFVQERPVPYRHCLGTALINAELLRIYMKFKDDILLANIWNLINEYWGMIANGFNGEYHTLGFPYYKRPNYLLFEMYTHHFGEYLVDSEIVYSPAMSSMNELKDAWTVHNFDGVDVKIDGDNISIDFSDPSKYNYFHTYNSVDIKPGTEYRLSGYLKSVNYQDSIGICLEIQDSRGWVKTKSTAVTERISGTTGWIYVETYYKTLPDAESVNVLIRRIGEDGPLSGKVFVKDVVLERIDFSTGIKASDLSVNSSTNESADKIYLMVINKNMSETITATINLKDFISVSNGNAWVLNGPAVDSTNEKVHNNVKITHKEFDTRGSYFEYNFMPHSLTAIEIERSGGQN